MTQPDQQNTTRWMPLWLREWLPALLFMLLILMARSTLADHYHVPSGSMEPSLMPGDHVLVDKSAFGYRLPFSKIKLGGGESPGAGDVVIFDSPVDGVRLIKRVVAVAGERVAVRGGRVLIDGVPRTVGGTTVEHYGNDRVALQLRSGGGPAMAETIVPPGQVLVLGDHRGNSRDGRYFGFVPAAALYGRASRVFWRRDVGPTWQEL